MKKYFLFLLFLLSTQLFSQDNKIEAGEFNLSPSSLENLKFILTEDNKFHLSVLSGTYQQVNDSIFFNRDIVDSSKFKLKFSNPNPKSDKITIDLGEGYYYQFYNIYLGTQENINSPVVYNKMKEFLNVTDEFDYQKHQLSFEIEKCDYIYIVEENLTGESIIEKYQVSNNVSKVEVTYSPNMFGKMKLKGIYNPSTKELIVTEGNTPLVFSKITTKEVAASEKPTETKSQKNWTYLGKIVEPTYDYSVDSSATAYGYADEVPQYVFKLKIEKTLDEAMKVANSYPDKVLMVFYDTNKEAKKEFDTYIESYQNNAQYYMYDKYNPEYDYINFYLATEKDKSSLKKLGITENQTVVFLNSDGVKLYHAKAKITDDNYAYYNMSSFNIDLQPINALAQLDNVILNKKKSISDFKKVLLKVTKSGRSNYTSVIPPPATEAVVQVREVGIDEVVKSVDSAATIVDSYDYSVLKEKNNIYKFKSTQKEVESRYKQLLDFHQNDKIVDADMVKMITNELSSASGFSAILFNKYNEALNANDFQSMDYLLKFFNEIPKIETENYYDQYPSSSLIGIISNALDRTSNKQQIDKAILYYDKLLKISNNDSWVLKGKMNVLKENLKDVEYLNTFENYYKSFIKDGSSIIEQLDKKYNPDTDYSWNEFKNSFANELNNVAWFVVEKVKNANPATITNAIKWSETSLKLEKDNYFYLDTLAQLYYKNGQKDLAILTEQKAIDAALLSSDSTLIEEYKAVLEKMKNGTY
jgi:hypothetical protein